MGWFRHALNKEPAMMIAGIFGGLSIIVPYIVVPIRKSLGLPTYQWDANPKTHPYLHEFGDNYKNFTFDDTKKLVSWSQHDTYGYKKPIQPKSYKERDFPEARARIAE